MLAEAFGPADRAHGVPNQVDTRIGVASAAKGLTALTVMALIERGTLSRDTTARSLLGDDLPLVDDGVTVEQLLGHRSGIGDYLDEDEEGDITDYVLTVPVHQLATTEDFLAVLDGYPTKFEPGTDFSYCNGGFVLLALLAERAAGTPFHDLVDELVCRPAGMKATAFLRLDELPSDAALGYLDRRRAPHQRPPPARPRHWRRRRLHDRRRRPRALERLLRRSDRVARSGCRRWSNPAATCPSWSAATASASSSRARPTR